MNFTIIRYRKWWNMYISYSNYSWISTQVICKKKKGKAIPVTGREGA
jgi:hypothetical protein